MQHNAKKRYINELFKFRGIGFQDDVDINYQYVELQCLPLTVGV